MKRRRRRWLTWVLMVTAGLGAAVSVERWRRRSRATQEAEAGNEPVSVVADEPAPVPPEAARPDPGRPAHRPPTPTSGPLISVIVATTDVVLADALAAITRQEYRDWELLAVVVDPGPPPVCDDGRVSIVLAPVGDRRTGERLALGRARGQIVTRGIPSDPTWLSALACQWQEDAGRVVPAAERAEDAFAALLDPGTAGPARAPGIPALSSAWPARPHARQPRRPALASAGG
jgi:hypothetical protein